jgi:hypothetical protein
VQDQDAAGILGRLVGREKGFKFGNICETIKNLNF